MSNFLFLYFVKFIFHLPSLSSEVRPQTPAGNGLITTNKQTFRCVHKDWQEGVDTQLAGHVRSREQTTQRKTSNLKRNTNNAKQSGQVLTLLKGTYRGRPLICQAEIQDTHATAFVIFGPQIHDLIRGFGKFPSPIRKTWLDFPLWCLKKPCVTEETPID